MEFTVTSPTVFTIWIIWTLSISWITWIIYIANCKYGVIHDMNDLNKNLKLKFDITCQFGHYLGNWTLRICLDTSDICMSVRISMDITDNFGPLGELIRIRYLYWYPERHPNISVYIQLLYPDDIRSLYPRVIPIDICMDNFVYPSLYKIFHVIFFYPLRSPNRYPNGYPNGIRSAYACVGHIDVYMDI